MAKDRPVGNMKFGLGVDGLDETIQTLDQLNRAIKVAESSMKANISAFDKAGASVEALDQKQKDLAKTTDLQNQKIQMLNKRREEYIQTYGKESKQVAKVTDDINKATAKYNGFSKQLDQTKQSYILASSGVDKYSKALKDNEQAMNDEIKAFKEAGDKAGALEAQQRGLKKQAELTEQAITAQKTAISKMAKEFGESSNEVQQAENKLEQFQRSAKNTDTKLDGVTTSLSKLSQEASQVDNKLDKAGKSLNDVSNEANDAKGGFDASSAALGGLVAGVASTVSTKALDIIGEAVSSITESFNEAVDASNKLQGSMGLTNKESKQYLQFANSLVETGMVDTLEEATEAITEVNKVSANMLNPQQFKQATKYAIAYSKTFDTDITEALRGATRMSTNFGISIEEAFDLLTAGAQNGLNQSDELADNMAEYSQLWSQMGFDASETFSILESGLQGGAYNLDKVNDLVKEMGISLADGRFEDNADMFSESTRKLFAEWKDGRATQAQVVKSMLDDFSKMGNGYEGLNKASTVWSALGEDNSLKVIDAMANASESFGETQGSANALNDTVGNTTAWQAFSAGVKGTINEIGIWATEFTGGMAEPIEMFFGETLPSFAAGIGTTLAPITEGFTNFFGGIKELFTTNGVKKYELLNSVGIGTETIWAMEDTITNVREKLDLFKGYITGFWKLATGNEAEKMDGYSMLRQLGMSEEDVKNLETTIDNVNTTLDTLKEALGKVVSDGFDKLNTALGDLYTIWTEKIAPDLLPLFSQFIGWLSRMAGYLATITGSLNGFGSSSRDNSNIVIEAFGLMWEGIKIKLGLIMALVETTMAIISGTIKVWSKIFEGDFRGAWEEIKNLWKNALNAVWYNIKDTLLGKVITSIGEFGGKFKGLFDGIVQTGQGILNGFNGFVWDIFVNLPGKIVEAFRGGKGAITGVFKEVFNAALRAIGKPVNGIIKGASWVLEKLGAEPLKEWDVPQYATGTPDGGHPGGAMMVNDGRGAEAVITPDGNAFIPKGRNVVMNAPKGTHVLTAEETAYLTGNKAPKYRYKKGTNFFGNMWDNVKGFAGNVGNKLKDTIGDVWNFMSNPKELAEKVLNGLGVLDGLTKYPLQVGKGLLSKAVSALTDKITGLFSSGNLDTSIGTNGVYKYLADVARDVMAKFPGFVATSGYRPGDPYSHGKRNAIDIALPGVTNGSPRYTEAANYAFEKFASKVGYVITNGQVRDRSGQSGTGIHDNWTPWTDGDHYDHVHINGIKNPQDKQISGENINGSGVERWRAVATQALRMTGQYSPSNLNALLNQMRTESNGNPNAINNWDINALNGTPSKGLLQVIDPTFRAYAMPGYNSNIFDPLSNILASIRYALSRYGSLTNAYRGVGYENGGIIKKQHMAMVGEGNKEEVVIPLTGTGMKRTRAMQLLAYANEKLNKKQTTTPSGGNGNDSMLTMIALLQEQNRLLQELLAKDSNVYMDGAKVNSKLSTIQETNERNQRRNFGLV